jgi:hypothetical protein
MPEKYKDEIEEILRKAGEVAPGKPSKESEQHPEDRSREPIVTQQPPAPDHRTGPRGPTITPGKLMLAGVIIFLIGIKFTPFLWIGLALLAGGYLLHFVKPRSISYEKRWRGRSVDDTSTNSWERLKRWLKS